MSTSRHNLSQAQRLFAGKVTFSPYQSDKLGVELHALFRWKPEQKAAAITFSAALAAGATSATLSADFSGPTGVYPITFSTGEQLNGLFTDGSEDVTFFAASQPLTGGSYGATDGLMLAETADATISGLPPVVGSSNGYSVSASIAAGGFAVLGGALAVAGVGIPDVPRNVVGAWTTDSIITVTGTDYYGQPQTEVGASAATFTGKKAFATITSIESSAAITAATFGTGNVLGLPFRVDGGDLYAPTFNDAADAGTFVPADQSVATSSTGDVRGTYAPSGTLNGYKWLSALLKVSDRNTQVGSFGVTPA